MISIVNNLLQSVLTMLQSASPYGGLPTNMTQFFLVPFPPPPPHPVLTCVLCAVKDLVTFQLTFWHPYWTGFVR